MALLTFSWARKRGGNGVRAPRTRASSVAGRAGPSISRSCSPSPRAASRWSAARPAIASPTSGRRPSTSPPARATCSGSRSSTGVRGPQV